MTIFEKTLVIFTTRLYIILHTGAMAEMRGHVFSLLSLSSVLSVLS